MADPTSTTNVDAQLPLVRYDVMRRAITKAGAVDEVKNIRDEALGLEAYARQALDYDAERQVCEIRLRAERRCGELLKEREMAKGGRPPKNRSQDDTDYRGADTLADLGISKQQSSDWQRLADIPIKDFEKDLSDRMWNPTTIGLLNRQEARKRAPLPPQDKVVNLVDGELDGAETMLDVELRLKNLGDVLECDVKDWRHTRKIVRKMGIQESDMTDKAQHHWNRILRSLEQLQRLQDQMFRAKPTLSKDASRPEQHGRC